MASIELWFPLTEVGPIAEHAMTAQQHSRSVAATASLAILVLFAIFFFDSIFRYSPSSE